LAVLAVAFLLLAPSAWQLPVTLGIGLLAWLAGALFGVGTAAWWVALYRRLILVDRPSEATTLLSGTGAAEARRGPLAAIVAVSSFLLAALLTIPWLQLP
jgi:hypothetical protein